MNEFKVSLIEPKIPTIHLLYRAMAITHAIVLNVTQNKTAAQTIKR